MFTEPLVDPFTLFVIAPTILLTPGAIGALLTFASIRLTRGRGASQTILRTGVTANAVNYAACIIGIVAIIHSGFPNPYMVLEYSLVWAILCSLVAYSSIIGIAVWCWNHPWRYP